jgi:hypothetical protein
MPLFHHEAWILPDFPAAAANTGITSHIHLSDSGAPLTRSIM